MGDRLISVGIDVGTSTTAMVLSALTVENRATGFSVPEMAITHRQLLYQSPVFFTPLKGQSLVDGEQLRQLLAQEYEKAGVDRAQVDTGAIIITGETSRKENASQVLQALSGFAGEFVVATAGPDLESVLAAKGAGALEYSEKTGKTVLHMDIGGGTSNLALIRQGQIVRTGCLNVGGRLIRLTPEGVISYLSPALKELCRLQVGEKPTQAQLQELTGLLRSALEMAAGRIKQTPLLEKLSTAEAQSLWQPPQEPVTVSLSGGVAECIRAPVQQLRYGDIGPLLAQQICNSALTSQPYILGKETIRATVIGAGCHSTQLSGSTVYCENVRLPKKNLPVVHITAEEQGQDVAGLLQQRLGALDQQEAVIALPGWENAGYAQLSRLAQQLAQGVGDRPVCVCLRGDMAKALGQRLSLLLPGRPVLCLDKLQLTQESYLDVGAPVGPCFPVVIKTLVLAAAEH